MSIQRSIGIFVSGFLVYSLVAAAGAAPKRGVVATVLAPVESARADSGARLKVKYTSGADGSRDETLADRPGGVTTFASAHVYWDSLRGEDCYFQYAADHVTRCLPLDIVVPQAVFFSDAMCTDLIVAPKLAPECQSVPLYYVSSGAPPDCGGIANAHFRKIGLEVALPPECYAPGPNNSCVPFACPNFAHYYQVDADEVDPSNFVAMTEMIDP
jgi:hypothetical protein